MYDTTKPYKRHILELIKQTWETPYVSVDEYVVRKKFSYPECRPHSDGIGTKGVYHWRQRSFGNAVIDALAMNLNDLALRRATPYGVIDHLFLQEDDKDAIFEITKHLAEECRNRDIALIDGETAIHDNMEGLEISITMMGFVKRPKPNRPQAGDVLIGFRSDGLHSNGFTKVREVFGREYRLEFIVPTRIYLDTVLALEESFDIHGMAHITGGAYTKLKDLLFGTDVRIRRDHKLQPQPIFRELYERGVDDTNMHKTFNCGVGFVLSVSSQDADKIVSELNAFDFGADIIGEITAGTGKVKIESMFSKKEIEF